MKKNSWIFGIFLMIFGMIFLVPNLEILTKKHILGWQEVAGEVSSFEKKLVGNSAEFIPIVDFYIGQNFYQRSLPVTKKTPQIGEKISIIFEKNDPSLAQIARLEAWRFVGFLPFLSGVFWLLSLKSSRKKSQIAFEKEGENDRKIAELRRTGVRIYGEIIDIEVLDNSSAKAIIRAKTLTGEVKNHRSAAVEGLTHGAIVRYLANPTPISIFVNPDNIEDYFVNTEDVEEIMIREED